MRAALSTSARRRSWCPTTVAEISTVPATVDALAGVVTSVGAQAPVIVDGGVRRGTDVAKALCLGASALMIGRPYMGTCDIRRAWRHPRY